MASTEGSFYAKTEYREIPLQLRDPASCAEMGVSYSDVPSKRRDKLAFSWGLTTLAFLAAVLVAARTAAGI
jgi:hypothetical protein